MAQKASWREINIVLAILVIITVFTALPANADSTLNPEVLKESATLPSVKSPIGAAHRKALKAYQTTKDPKHSIKILEDAGVAGLAGKDPETASLTKGQYAAVLNDYAYFLYLAGQKTRALPILNRVIEVDPERVAAYLNRGDIYGEVYGRTKDIRDKELYVADYRAYNERMIRDKKSFLVPERVERGLYALEIKQPPVEKEKRRELEEKLYEAAKMNNIEEVVRLLKEGADPNAGAYVAPLRYSDNDVLLYQSKSYETPLDFAALQNNIEMAKYLIYNGATVHMRSLQRNTPLHYAACGGDLEMVKYLLGKGAIYDYPNNNSFMPVGWAIGCKDGEHEEEVFDFLLSINNGRYINGATLDEIIKNAGGLKDRERGLRVVRDIFTRFRKRISTKALGESYVKAVMTDNRKLVDFYRKNKVKIDTDEYIGALIRGKKFDEAKKVIESAKKLGRETFSSISLIPVYKTDWKCERGQERYEGNEVEELLLPAIKAYNLSKPTESNNHDLIFSRFLDQLSSYSFKYPLCFNKARTIKVVRLMLENGLNPAFLNSGFHYIVALNDLELAKEVLEKISVDEKICYYLFANARSMEMVRFLESHGFSLSNEEYKRLVEHMEKKTFPDTDRSVIVHYKTKIK
ncbi:MAG: ankyrin repeat domain-containing protein [Deltaproteobacteria bacterium]|nr:ankyrin repeat domain-containing protein [Deltaproteobacteria bacterium]